MLLFNKTTLSKDFMSLITLKSVKIFDSLSEETTAFSAKIYWKGKLAGDCSNRGYGGCNDFYIKDQKTLSEMESYATSLPSSFLDGHEIKSNLDLVISYLIEDIEKEKARKKIDKWVMKQKEKVKNSGFLIIRIDSSQGSLKTTTCITFNPNKENPENLVNQWKLKNPRNLIEEWRII